MMLSSLLRLLKVNSSHPDLFFFLIIEQFITAIENVRFEIYLRFIWIQTYIFFYFSLRLSAEHHTVSFWCRIFSSRPKSRKIQILSISKIFFTFVIVRDRTRMKSPLRWLEHIGMVSEKLYRNTLKVKWTKISTLFILVQF